MVRTSTQFLNATHYPNLFLQKPMQQKCIDALLRTLKTREKKRKKNWPVNAQATSLQPKLAELIIMAQRTTRPELPVQNIITKSFRYKSDK